MPDGDDMFVGMAKKELDARRAGNQVNIKFVRLGCLCSLIFNDPRGRNFCILTSDPTF